MKLDEMVLLKEEGKSTHIFAYELGWSSINCKVFDFLNGMCLRHGTSVQGSQESFKAMIQVRQKVPIMICQKRRILLFPITDTHGDKWWIRYDHYMKVKKISEHKSQLYLSSTMIQEFDVNLRMIQRQLKRCSQYVQLLDNFEKSSVLEALSKAKPIKE